MNITRVDIFVHVCGPSNVLGDSPTHAIWEETFEGQLNHSKMVLDHLKDKLNGTPVYLNLGNHGK